MAMRTTRPALARCRYLLLGVALLVAVGAGSCAKPAPTGKICQPGQDGMFPDPSSRKIYHVCIESSSATMTCPGNTQYDDQTKMCTATESKAKAAVPTVVLSGFDGTKLSCAEAVAVFKTAQRAAAGANKIFQVSTPTGHVVFEGVVKSISGYKGGLKPGSVLNFQSTKPFIEELVHNGTVIPGTIPMLKLQASSTVRPGPALPTGSRSCTFDVRMADPRLDKRVEVAVKQVTKQLATRLSGLVPAELTSSKWNGCDTYFTVTFSIGIAACVAAVVSMAFTGGLTAPVALTVCMAAGAFIGVNAGGRTICVQAVESCFPAHSLVMLPGQVMLPISQLAIGHSVLSVGPSQTPVYDEVYLWGHRNPDIFGVFKSITLSNHSDVLDLSPGHYLPIHRTSSSRNSFANPPSVEFEMMPAKHARVGDTVLVFHQAAQRFLPATISSIDDKVYRGLFNPLTLGGQLVVNNVLVSAHSEWFLDNIMPASMLKHTPAIYQATLAPARALYWALGPDVVRLIDENIDLAESFGKGGLWGYARGLAYVARVTAAGGPDASMAEL